MTTLFSLFAPVYLMVTSLKFIVFTLSITVGLGLSLSVLLWIKLNSLIINSTILKAILPTSGSGSALLLSLFILLSSLNLMSLVVYGYPMTTTLGFNLSSACLWWFTGMFLALHKMKASSSILPSDSPWYLIPFLCLVELTSILVRPVTLCFRLLANMVAGHVLLALICKLPVAWLMGGVLGVLELMVSLVQAFVFTMLISVYLEEALTH